MYNILSPVVVAINGPPYSGKSTLASELVDLFPGVGTERKMAMPIDHGLRNTLGISQVIWDYLREEGKEGPIMLGSKTTVRKALINFSEDFMKPTFGDDIFGRIAAERIVEDFHLGGMKVVAISDTGFQKEYEAVYKRCQEEGFRIILVQCQKEGCTFEGDSRGDVFPVEDEPFLIWQNLGDKESLDFITAVIQRYIWSDSLVA